MDMGNEAIMAEHGLTHLLEAIEQKVVLYKGDEARALFKAGSSSDGPMSRQLGEPMADYISRRQRWVARLHALESETKVSENILADYLLEFARLTARPRSCTRCGVAVNRIYVKKQSWNIEIKITKWNSDLFKTAYVNTRGR